MHRERPLHADPEGQLADGEGAARPGALLLEDHALEDLRPAPSPSTTWKCTRTRSPTRNGGRRRS